MRESLHRINLPPGEHRQQGDATVDGAIGGVSVDIVLHERHGAGAAVAFGASLLAARTVMGPQPVEQRRRGRDPLDPHRFAV